MPPFRLIALTLCCLAAAACAPPIGAPADASSAAAPGAVGGEPASDPSRSSAAEAGPPTGDFRVVSVLLGNQVDADNIVLGDHAVFGRRDAIHASVLSTGTSQGLRLSARWLGPDGEAIAETAQPLVATRATAATFSLRNAQPWPVGDYQVVIAIDGRPEQTRRFQIR
jgi:hypothetical protein